MNTRCPTCGRAVATPNRQQRRRQLAHQIARLDERIRSIENGDLLGVIRQQAAAPSCTVCEQAPPGKPGQPTTAPALARPLRQQKRRLERELKRLT